MKEPITITETAETRFADMIKNSDKNAIRFGIKGGGCSGFQFYLDFDNVENKADDDELLDRGDVKVIVDGCAMMYIVGTTIDWVEDIMGSHFSFKAPQQKAMCGCGTSVSFKVKDD